MFGVILVRIYSISPYSVRMRENAGKITSKIANIFDEVRHFQSVKRNNILLINLEGRNLKKFKQLEGWSLLQKKKIFPLKCLAG